ncbi:hypothetical protein AV530_004250 [Patagioenas fasciata monilis]|uniref:Uncharacterized protein n=1 Tax=Patagioenas fasciata monilis TaxID=372326 RepID=A0A1V4K8Q7_PATFA|nr:hypothetical protein AV530_004250 [Patagioenas fasciata monilis]
MKGSGMHLREQPSFDGFFLLMLSIVTGFEEMLIIIGKYLQRRICTDLGYLGIGCCSQLLCPEQPALCPSHLELRNAAAREEPLPWPSAVTIYHLSGSSRCMSTDLHFHYSALMADAADPVTHTQACNDVLHKLQTWERIRGIYNVTLWKQTRKWHFKALSMKRSNYTVLH